jgi:hypothetical protein
MTDLVVALTAARRWCVVQSAAVVVGVLCVTLLLVLARSDDAGGKHPSCWPLYCRPLGLPS